MIKEKKRRGGGAGFNFLTIKSFTNLTISPPGPFFWISSVTLYLAPSQIKTQESFVVSAVTRQSAATPRIRKLRYPPRGNGERTVGGVGLWRRLCEGGAADDFRSMWTANNPRLDASPLLLFLFSFFALNKSAFWAFFVCLFCLSISLSWIFNIFPFFFIIQITDFGDVERLICKIWDAYSCVCVLAALFFECDTFREGAVQ